MLNGLPLPAPPPPNTYPVFSLFLNLPIKKYFFQESTLNYQDKSQKATGLGGFGDHGVSRNLPSQAKRQSWGRIYCFQRQPEVPV